MKEYEQIHEEKGLPIVGQTVRSKKYHTLWRVSWRKGRFGATLILTAKAVNSAWSRPYISFTGRFRRKRLQEWGKRWASNTPSMTIPSALNWDIVKD